MKGNKLFLLTSVLIFLLSVLVYTGCFQNDDKDYYTWTKIEPAGAVCGNGSQYKFFVNYSPNNENLVVYFEGGGACWDYESCTGQTGIRGAANPNGIPDDYMSGISQGRLMSPFVFRPHPWDPVPTNDWNIVFVPYCTGDIFIGNIVKTYKDPTGVQPDLIWHHNGMKNTLAIIEWIKKEFTSIPKLLVTGCSAGGAGSILNYLFIRQGLNADNGYLLNDSGPIYPAPDATYNSYMLHQTIRAEWNLDSVINKIKEMYPQLPSELVDPDNYGSINSAIAQVFPNDRKAHTQFTLDGNYSGYSYERFFGCEKGGCPELIHELWAEDQNNLMSLYDDYSNMEYFIPYFRPFNDSHCSTILSFNDTDIQSERMDVGDYIDQLLNNRVTLRSYYEEPNQEDIDRPWWGWDVVDLLMDAM